MPLPTEASARPVPGFSAEFGMLRDMSRSITRRSFPRGSRTVFDEDGLLRFWVEKKKGCGIKGFYPTSVIRGNLPRYVVG